MIHRATIRTLRTLVALGAGYFLSAIAIAAPAVRVTLQLDDSVLKVGQLTTAHVKAQIVPDQLSNTVQIVTWYVDFLNSASTVFQIQPATIVVPESDSQTGTSSKGTFTAGNLRTIYDTMANTPGAGHESAVELFSVQVKAIAVGTATFSVAAGSGAPALDQDFIVSTVDGDPLFGGLYDTASVQVTSFNNVPPTIDPIANISVNEGSRMSVTAVGHDADAGQTLRYTLVGAQPVGAVLDPNTGVLAWTPAENQGPGIYTFKIKVADNGTPSLSATNQFDIVVGEINTAPTLQVPATINRAELQPITTTCIATDADILQGRTPNTNRLSFSLLNAPPGATINPSTGAFAWTATEAQGPGNYTIRVMVTDDGVPPMAATNTFVISITEQNLAPSITAPANQTIAEGATMNVAFVATDPDLPANNLTFSLVSGPTGVVLDPATGLVTWTPTEAQGPAGYTIRVAVSDNAPTPLFATNSFTVLVTEVNAAPTLEALQDRSVNELTALTFTAIARDADLPAQTLTFSLDSPPAGASINPTTGAFSWTPTEAQGPGRYTIVVRVTDNGSPARFDTKSFDVVVNEQNAAPNLVTPTGQGTQTVPELSTVRIQFTGSDSDVPANLVSFSLQNAPQGATIDAATGAFVWIPSEAQGPGVYTIRAVATDNGTPPLSTTNTITLTVTEANTAPILDPIDNQIVDELSTLTVNVSARDTDLPAQTLTFSLAAAPAGATINPTTGVFTWTPTEAQGPGQFAVTVRVAESGAAALTASRTFTVTVNEVNATPRFTSGTTLTFAELFPINARLVATDSDVLNGQTPPTNSITYSLLDAPTGMTVDPVTGALAWTPTEAQGPGVYQVRAAATDNGIPAQTATITMSVTVTEGNRAPTIRGPGDQTVAELAPLNVTFTATDPDIPSNTLTFSALLPPAGLQIDPASGVLTWTPSEAQGPGVYAIKVVVTDNGTPALSATNTMNVTVTEVATKPVLAAIPDFSITAGSPFTFTAGATDADLPAQTITYSLDSAPAGATINGASGIFSWTPATALGGQQFTVVVRATESGASPLFDTKSFKISVTPRPNTAPAIAAPNDQTIVAGAKLNVPIIAVDADTPASALIYAIASGPTGAAIDAAGVLTWTPGLSQVGQTQIRIKVTDNGVPAMSNTNSFMVTVTAPLNTAPTILSPADQTVAVGAKLTVTNVATDVDIPANTLTFALVSAPTGVAIDSATGVLTWTPTSAQVGMTQIQVKVTDNGVPALSNTNSFSVTVTGGSGGQAATLRLISVLAAGTTIRVDGTANASYDIEYSTDLLNWTPLTTLTVGGQGFVSHLDTAHGFGQAKGFYRAKTGGSTTVTAPTIQPQSIGPGGLTLRLTGSTGATYRIHFSTDLLNWTPLGSASITTGTTVDYTDTAQPTRGVKGFYRATFP